MIKQYELAIIGGGLAGLSAAIEADKLNIKTVLFESSKLGGIAFNGGDVVLTNLFKRLNELKESNNIDINEIKQMIDNNLEFVNNNRNNLFSDSFHINKLLLKELTNHDELLIQNNHEVFYQPKVKPNTYEIIGAELLSRFKIDGKFVSPLPFINIFEQRSTIINLDLKMLEYGASFLSDLLAEKLVDENFKFSINFSPKTINTISPLRLRDIVGRYNLNPNNIILELTERTEGTKSINTKHLCRLKEMGFILSMDDFSIGNSSLDLLNQINFDEVKLDMSLFPKNEEDFEKITTFDNLLNLINYRNKSVVIEGVETKEQDLFLNKRKTNSYQGYYFSKPISKIDFLMLLKEN